MTLKELLKIFNPYKLPVVEGEGERRMTQVWILSGYSWEAGAWLTLDVYSTKEKAQQDVIEDHGDNYRYDPSDDTYYCTNDNFDIVYLKIMEKTVR